MYVTTPTLTHVSQETNDIALNIIGDTSKLGECEAGNIESGEKGTSFFLSCSYCLGVHEFINELIGSKQIRIK